MRLKLDSRAPVYIQVMEYFKVQIASGELEKGAEIPSRRELANTLKINPNTVQRAYKEMEEAGLIYTDGNMPSKVTDDQVVINDVKAALLKSAVGDFVTSIKALHVQLDEILPLIEEKYMNLDQGSEEGNDD